MNFFLDRSIEAESLYRALVAAGAQVERHSAHFRHDELDAVWLSQAAARGWVIITRDRRIRYRPLERQAVVASGARLFSVVAGNLAGSALADLLVGHLPRIASLAVSTPAPFLAVVRRDGVSIAFRGRR